jgi:hypothetical protein
MILWGPSMKIEQRDDGEMLVFYFERQLRLLDLLLPALVAGIAGGIWLGLKWGLLFAVLASAAVYLHSIASQRLFSLSVSRNGLGYGNSNHLPWSKIVRLEYVSGGENNPPILSAKTGRWSSERLIEGLNREQAEGIIHTINTRFPFVEMAEDPGSLLDSFMREPEFVELGLSAKQKK